MAKRMLRVLIVAVVLVVGLFLYLNRDFFVEVSCVYRLQSEDTAAKKSAIETLKERGGSYCVPYVLEVLEAGILFDSAVDTLGSVCPRVNRKAALEIADRLLAQPVNLEERPFEIVRDALNSASARDRRILPRLLEASGADNSTTRRLACSAVAAAWEHSTSEIWNFLEEAKLDTVQSFLRHQGKETHIGVREVWRNVAAPLEGNARRIADRLRREHPDEKVRAVALAYLVVDSSDSTSGVHTYDPTPLTESYAEDQSLLVKAAALRVAGVLGYFEHGLDLTSILLEERNPVLLKEIVQARTLWEAAGLFLLFHLWDGFVCYWLPHDLNATRRAKPWGEEEVARLQEILAEARDPGLRDAASLAFASRYRNLKRKRRSQPDPVRLPGLKVHEWGVWTVRKSGWTTPSRIVEDLPAFVHRSSVRADELWDQRTYSPMEVFKPVVFFHSPRPVSLLVEIDFLEGRPWTYFPRATDYTLRTSRRGWPVSRATPRSPSNLPPRKGDAQSGDASSDTAQPPAPIHEREGFTPPWIDTSSPLPSPKPSLPRRGQVKDFSPPLKHLGGYHLAPWLTPHHRRSANTFGWGTTSLASVGLEWCGLRVGYPPELEARRPDASGCDWWGYLREVPAAPVAVRGEHESFLFYDGSVNMPPPLRLSWSDSKRDALAIQVRPFGEYPESPSSSEVSRSWWLSDHEKDSIRRTTPIPAVLVVHVGEGGELRGRLLERLSPANRASVVVSNLEIDGDEVPRRFQEVLESQGLTAPEAASLVRTWRAEFFATPGLRVLAVLPRWIYDAVLPMRVFPVPGETVRVGVVWTECDDLEVVGENRRSEPDRWRPDPWNMAASELKLKSRKWQAGPLTTLELNQHGEIAAGEGTTSRSALSHDGSKLVFGVLSGPLYRIILADFPRRRLQEVARFEAAKMENPGSVSISGDGNRVAYAFELEGGRGSELVDLERELVFDLDGRFPLDLSKDGQKLLCSSRVSASGSRTVLLDFESKKEIIVQTGTSVAHHSLSHDGRKILFASTGQESEVYLVDLEAETILNVSRSGGRDSHPGFSGDGERIVFESERDRDYDIYLADLDRASLVNLTNRSGKDRFPAISPDGKTLLYRDWEAGFCLLDVESGEKQVIPNTRGVWTMEVSGGGETMSSVRWRDKTPYLSVMTSRPPDRAERGELEPGLAYRYSESGDWRTARSVAGAVPLETGVTRSVDVALGRRSEHFGLHFAGFIKVPRDGLYTFFTRSDDASLLFIGDRLLVDNDGVHGAREASGSVLLQKGMHEISISYTQTIGERALAVSWSGPGIPREAIPVARFFHDARAAGL